MRWCRQRLSRAAAEPLKQCQLLLAGLSNRLGGQLLGEALRGTGLAVEDLVALGVQRLRPSGTRTQGHAHGFARRRAANGAVGTRVWVPGRRQNLKSAFLRWERRKKSRTKNIFTRI